MNANELADILEDLHEQDKIDGVAHLAMPEAADMLRQQQAEIEALKKQVGIWEKETMNARIKTSLYQSDESFDRTASHMADEYVSHPAKTLTDEEWNKAFEYYCETDEGVLRFNYELRDEWKKEQLIRWKEALRKANEK